MGRWKEGSDAGTKSCAAPGRRRGVLPVHRSPGCPLNNSNPLAESLGACYLRRMPHELMPPRAEETARSEGSSTRSGLNLKMGTFVGFVLCHVLALLALLPWLFSWIGVASFVVGLWLFGILGINIGFHRLLTHRSFRCPQWLERTFAILGTCGLQFSPAFWVAVHRCHHQHSDDEDDPHSPLHGFLWAHFGWLVTRRPEHQNRAVLLDRYARDLMRDPFYRLLERGDNWIRLPLLSWFVFFSAGFVGAMMAGQPPSRALQLGASLFVWGGVLRTVFVWHTTWAVNSVTHYWGYRNYATPDDSRNNAIVAVLAGGEGWHNNHHANPRAARHGHKWWELDSSWITIRLLMALGLATNVVRTSPEFAASPASPAIR